MRSGKQVVTLAGVDVLTIPPKVAAEYLQMNVKKDDLYLRNWRDLEVNLNPDRAVEVRSLTQLWDISPEYISFVEDAVRQADGMETGEDLMRLARDHHVGLFHDWTPEDRRKIREKGKIPEYHRLARRAGGRLDVGFGPRGVREGPGGTRRPNRTADRGNADVSGLVP